MRNTEKWLELAYAKLEEEKDEHRDKMKLELYKLQNEYTLKVEEYKFKINKFFKLKMQNKVEILYKKQVIM